MAGTEFHRLAVECQANWRLELGCGNQKAKGFHDAFNHKICLNDTTADLLAGHNMVAHFVDTTGF
jgi:hypothetical protein